MRVLAADPQSVPAVLATELPKGTPLEASLPARGVPAGQVAAMLAPVAEALAAAHAANVVHGDLRPANILVARQPRIVGFGLATFASRHGQPPAGLVIGDPDYWSPEQAHGRPLTRAADIFALGRPDRPAREPRHASGARAARRGDDLPRRARAALGERRRGRAARGRPPRQRAARTAGPRRPVPAPPARAGARAAAAAGPRAHAGAGAAAPRAVAAAARRATSRPRTAPTANGAHAHALAVARSLRPRDRPRRAAAAGPPPAPAPARVARRPGPPSAAAAAEASSSPPIALPLVAAGAYAAVRASSGGGSKAKAASSTAAASTPNAAPTTPTPTVAAPAPTTPAIALTAFPGRTCRFGMPAGWQEIWADLNHQATYANVATGPGDARVDCEAPARRGAPAAAAALAAAREDIHGLPGLSGLTEAPATIGTLTARRFAYDYTDVSGAAPVLEHVERVVIADGTDMSVTVAAARAASLRAEADAILGSYRPAQ